LPLVIAQYVRVLQWTSGSPAKEINVTR